MIKERVQESDKVKDAVAKYLREYKRLFPEFIQTDESIWITLDQRAEIPGIRSYIAYKLYTLSGGKNWKKDIAPLLGVMEMSIVSTYSTNRVFDRKKGGTTEIEVIKSIMASAFARDGIYYILKRHYTPDVVNRLQLWYEISDIHRWFYLGQYINSFKNVLPGVIKEDIVIEDLPEGFNYVERLIDKVKALLQDRISGLTENELDILLRNQFIRLYLVNSHYYERFAVLSIRLHKNVTLEQKSMLEGFGALYGVGSQIVNDVIDFALPSMGLECMAKTGEDFFNDLKNRIITFPIFLGLYSKTNTIGKRILANIYLVDNINVKLSESQMNKLLFYLLDSKAIQTSLQIASIYLEEAEKCLKDAHVLKLDSSMRDIFRISKESRFVVSMFKWYRKQKQLYRNGVNETCRAV